MKALITTTSTNALHRSLALVICAIAMTGCARYEFDVIQPPDFARHIADKWENARWGPVDYRLRVMENHLVMEIHNVTREEIRILGDRSYVVGPNGQSHPLATQTIAPESFVRLILPPMPRMYERSGPTIGFGLGVGFSSVHHGRGRYFGGGLYDPFDEPRYIAVYDGAAWDWPGEGEARMTLALQVGADATKAVTHAFVFRKKKV